MFDDAVGEAGTSRASASAGSFPELPDELPAPELSGGVSVPGVRGEVAAPEGAERFGPLVLSAVAVEVFARLDADLDAVLGLDVSGAGLLAVLTAMEVHRRRLAAVDQWLIAEVQEQGVAARLCVPSTAAVVRELLRVSPGEAKARTVAAANMGPRRELTGAGLPAVFAEVAAAQATGVISVEHAAVIVRTVNDLPYAVKADHGWAVEETLVEQARHFDPTQLRVLAKRVSDLLDPDGKFVDDADQHRRRGLTLTSNRDGSFQLAGTLTPLCGAVWQAVFDSVSAPCPATDGTPDPRSPAARNHDGFQDVGLFIARSTITDLPHTTTTASTSTSTSTSTTDTSSTANTDTATAGNTATGTTGSTTGGTAGSTARGKTAGAGAGAGAGAARSGAGVRAQVLFVLTGTATDAQNRTGYMTTSHGGLIPMEHALDLTTDSQTLSVLFDPHGAILDYGMAKRLVPLRMRLALTARDHGCTFPGCDRPPAYCQAHHLTEYANDGPTSLNNTTLVCNYHHREFPKQGWQSIMLNGTPHWIPPTWIDPQQVPRKNTTRAPLWTSAGPQQ